MLLRSVYVRRRFSTGRTSLSVKDSLTSIFRDSLRRTFPDVQISDLFVNRSSVSGVDYQYNGAFALAKSVHQTPQQVAQHIASHLSPSPVVRCAQAVKGFINVQLTDEWIGRQIQQVATRPDYLRDSIIDTDRRSILVDFASPNMGKELHVGHLRSIVLGDCLARVLEACGHEVRRVSHVGDLGLPIAMVVRYVMEMTQAGQQQDPSTYPFTASELANIYERAKKRFDEDAEFAKRAQTQTVTLQQSLALADPSVEPSVGVWRNICACSRLSYQEIYDLLSVRVEERGESTYAPLLQTVVDELCGRKVAAIDEGATVIFMDSIDTPMLIRKKDGGYLYATVDLTALRERVKAKHDWIIYVTDSSQELHFKQLFKAAEIANFVDRSRVRLDHVTFGVIQGENGKKLSSRDGSPYSLKQLLLDGAKQAQETLEVLRPSEQSTPVAEEERQQRTLRLAIGAVKYFDLSHSRTKNYILSPKRMLSLKGNTSVYINYAYTRLASISRQSHGNMEWKHVMLDRYEYKEPTERSLALAVIQFPDVIEQVVKTLSPHLLCEYLYDIATRFHVFYEHCRVLGGEQETVRLQLCHATLQVLQQGMDLLGVERLDRM